MENETFTYKGEWESNTAYAINDVVIYKKEGYFCMTDGPKKKPRNGKDWKLVPKVAYKCLACGSIGDKCPCC